MVDYQYDRFVSVFEKRLSIVSDSNCKWILVLPAPRFSILIFWSSLRLESNLIYSALLEVEKPTKKFGAKPLTIIIDR